MPATALDHHYRDLERDLAVLSARHRLVFAASCAEVLKQNYRAFSTETRWGDAEVVDKCVAAAWECAVRGSSGSAPVADLIEHCKEVAPDTEEFDEASTSSALNAVSAAVAALEACVLQSPRAAIDAATAAIETVWMYVEVRDQMDPNDPELEVKILRDPLAIQELARQRRLLEVLRTLPRLDAADVERIRQSSKPLLVT